MTTATGQAVLQALGVDHIRHITSLRLEAQGHHAPVVTLTLYLPQITTERTQHFELRALPDAPRPLDLDRLCDAAMARISDHIHRSAAEHLRQISPRGWRAPRADLLIGAAYLTPRPPHYARAASGPHRAPDTLGDKAVKWASAIGALVVAGLLVLERLS